MLMATGVQWLKDVDAGEKRGEGLRAAFRRRSEISINAAPTIRPATALTIYRPLSTASNHARANGSRMSLSLLLVQPNDSGVRPSCLQSQNAA